LAWIDWADEAFADLKDGDPVAVADLEALADELDHLNGLGCAMLGGAWAHLTAGGLDEPDPDVVVGYFRVEAFLLALDYLGVLVDYMDLPEVQWLEAEGLQLRDDLYFPDDSAGEYLTAIRGAFRDAAWEIEYLSP